MKNLRIEEDIIYSGPANRFMNIESVDGMLFLTSNELIFKSNGMNIQNNTYRIDIKKIKKFKYLLFLPTVLQFMDDLRSKETFIVVKRKAWIREIKSAQSRG